MCLCICELGECVSIWLNNPIVLWLLLLAWQCSQIYGSSIIYRNWFGFTLFISNEKCSMNESFFKGMFFLRKKSKVWKYEKGPPQVKCRLLISSIFWKCYKLNSSIPKKCWKFIASKMLEIKYWHLTWVGPICYIG